MCEFNSVLYPTFIDGEKGVYGVSFPDLPGISKYTHTYGHQRGRGGFY